MLPVHPFVCVRVEFCYSALSPALLWSDTSDRWWFYLRRRRFIVIGLIHRSTDWIDWVYHKNQLSVGSSSCLHRRRQQHRQDRRQTIGGQSKRAAFRYISQRYLPSLDQRKWIQLDFVSLSSTSHPISPHLTRTFSHLFASVAQSASLPLTLYLSVSFSASDTGLRSVGC